MRKHLELLMHALQFNAIQTHTHWQDQQITHKDTRIRRRQSEPINQNEITSFGLVLSPKKQ